MITPLTLQDGLNDFLEKEVAAKYLLKSVDRNGDEASKNPQIIRSGWILPKSIDRENPEEAFPYITTRIDRVEISKEREAVVTMLILFGVYDPGVYSEDGELIDDGSGYRDVWNLIETTRQALFRRLVIEKKYRMVDDFFEAEMLKEQVYPYWEGLCRTKWQVLFPMPDTEADFC